MQHLSALHLSGLEAESTQFFVFCQFHRDIDWSTIAERTSHHFCQF